MTHRDDMDGRTDSDRLLDLLYGELSAQEEEEVRRRLDEDSELAEEYEKLRVARQEVSAQIPDPEEMPKSVRDSILDAATEERDRGPKRRKSGADKDRGWSFGPSTTVGFKAGMSVAVAVLVAGAVYAVMSQAGFFDDSVEEMAVAQAPAEGEAVVDEEVGAAEFAELDKQEVAEETIDTAEELASESTEAREEADEEPGEALADEILDGDEEYAVREERVERRREPAPRPEPAPQLDRAPSPEPQPDDDADDGIDLFGGGGEIGGSGGPGRSAGGGSIGTSVGVEEAEAEAPEPDETEAAALLDEAEEAYEEGDLETAQRLLEEFYDTDVSDELDDLSQRRAEQLRGDLEEGESKEDVDVADTDEPNDIFE